MERWCGACGGWAGALQASVLAVGPGRWWNMRWLEPWRNRTYRGASAGASTNLTAQVAAPTAPAAPQHWQAPNGRSRSMACSVFREAALAIGHGALPTLERAAGRGCQRARVNQGSERGRQSVHT